MIRRIKIRDFKSIREVDLELDPVTVLVGRSGTGKLIWCRQSGSCATTCLTRRRRSIMNSDGIVSFLWAKRVPRRRSRWSSLCLARSVNIIIGLVSDPVQDMAAQASTANRSPSDRKRFFLVVGGPHRTSGYGSTRRRSSLCPFPRKGRCWAVSLRCSRSSLPMPPCPQE